MGFPKAPIPLGGAPPSRRVLGSDLVGRSSPWRGPAPGSSSVPNLELVIVTRATCVHIIFRLSSFDFCFYICCNTNPLPLAHRRTYSCQVFSQLISVLFFHFPSFGHHLWPLPPKPSELLDGEMIRPLSCRLFGRRRRNDRPKVGLVYFGISRRVLSIE